MVRVNSPYGNATRSSSPRGGGVCDCCKRPWSACVGETTQAPVQRAQSTCPPCYDHGPDSMPRDRAHIALWRSLAEARADTHRAEAARLRARLAELEHELSDRPVQTVDRYVDADELREAKEGAVRAYRSRDYAYQALCMIRLLHREGEPGRCRCGERLDQCPIAEIVAQARGLDRWEKAEFERFRRGERHMLPDNHPGVLDPQHWAPA
jgi:hypothetical protein